MVKKILIGIGIVAVLIPTIASAQTPIGGPNFWKVISGVLQPISSAYNLLIGALSGGGTQCVQVDNTGLFSGSGSPCGSGGGSGSTTIVRAIAPIVVTQSGINATTSCPTCLTTSTGLTVANFATSSVSQFVNDAGYVTSTGASAPTGTAFNFPYFLSGGTGLAPTSSIVQSSSTGNIGLFTTAPLRSLDVLGSSPVINIGTGGTGGDLYFGDNSNNEIQYQNSYFSLFTNQTLGFRALSSALRQSASSTLFLLGLTPSQTIQGGSASGTVLGGNLPLGFNGDFENWEVNSTTVMKVSATGTAQFFGNLLDAGGNKYITSTPSGVATTSINQVLGPNFTFSLASSANAFSISTSSASVVINLPNNLAAFNNDKGFITSAPATSTITASGTTLTGPSFTFGNTTSIVSFASGTTLFWKFANNNVSQFINDAGYVTSTSGGGVATTSINGTQAASFQIIGSGAITSTVSGATTTFSFINPGFLTNASVTAQSPLLWSTTSTLSCPTCLTSAAATTTINNFTSQSFAIQGDGISVTSTVNGSTTIFSTIGDQGEANYYFTNVASDVSSNKVASDTPVSVLASTTVAALSNGTTSLQQWATIANVPSLPFIPAGLFDVHIDAAQTAGTKPTFLYAVVNDITSTGTVVATILQTENGPVLTGTLTDYDLLGSLSDPYTMASTTDRIQVNVFASVSGALLAPTVQVYYGGSSADSRLELPASTADVTNFIPYVGAIKNVNLGSNSLSLTGTLTAASATFSGNIAVGGATLSGNSIESIASGTQVGLRIKGTNSTDQSFATFLNGDNFIRFNFSPTGVLNWGSGFSVADTNLYRTGTSTLGTDNNFKVTLGLTVNGSSTLGNSVTQSGGINSFSSTTFVGSVTSTNLAVTGVTNALGLFGSGGVLSAYGGATTSGGSNCLLSVTLSATGTLSNTNGACSGGAGGATTTINQVNGPTFTIALVSTTSSQPSITTSTANLSLRLSNTVRLATWIVAPAGGDFTTIQPAMDACGVTGGGTIYIQQGTYAQATTGLLWKGSNCKIYGINGTTTITITGATTAFKTNSSSSAYTGNEVHNIQILGDNTTSSVGFDMSDMSHQIYDDVVMDSIAKPIILHDTKDITFYNSVEHFNFTTVKSIGIDGSSTEPWNENNFGPGFIGCSSANCVGISDGNSQNNTFHDIAIEPNAAPLTGSIGILIFDSAVGTNPGNFGNQFNQMYMEGNASSVVEKVGASCGSGECIAGDSFNGGICNRDGGVTPCGNVIPTSTATSFNNFNNNFQVDTVLAGNLSITGVTVAPTVSAGGTLDPRANNNVGFITVTVGGVTTKTLTFSVAYPFLPICQAQVSSGTGLTFVSKSTATNVLFTASAAIPTTTVVSYICIGNNSQN